MKVLRGPVCFSLKSSKRRQYLRPKTKVGHNNRWILTLWRKPPLLIFKEYAETCFLFRPNRVWYRVTFKNRVCVSLGHKIPSWKRINMSWFQLSDRESGSGRLITPCMRRIWLSEIWHTRQRVTQDKCLKIYEWCGFGPKLTEETQRKLKVWFNVRGLIPHIDQMQIPATVSSPFILGVKPCDAYNIAWYRMSGCIEI